MLYYNLRLPLLRYFSRLLTAVEPWVFLRNIFISPPEIAGDPKLQVIRYSLAC